MKNEEEKFRPPPFDVWWESDGRFCKARLWMDARRQIGGHPTQVKDAALVEELDQKAER